MLTDNVFTFGKGILKQKRGTTIRSKLAPSYSILFMAELKEEMIKESAYNRVYGGSTLMTYFSHRNMTMIKELFIENINKVHSIIKNIP